MHSSMLISAHKKRANGFINLLPTIPEFFTPSFQVYVAPLFSPQFLGLLVTFTRIQFTEENKKK